MRDWVRQVRTESALPASEREFHVSGERPGLGCWKLKGLAEGTPDAVGIQRCADVPVVGGVRD